MRPIKPINEIAADALRHWKKPTPEALAALKMMATLEFVTDDGAREVIERFLANARFFMGKHARRVKAELDAMLNSSPPRTQLLRRSQMAARCQLKQLWGEHAAA